MTTHTLLQRSISLALLGLLAGCQSLYFRTLNTGVGAAKTVTHGVEYAPGRHLDVYVPERSGAASTPVMLFLYGGRWQGGSRSDYAFVGQRFAAAGVLTVVADYRLFPEVRFPQFVEDAAQALAWTRRNARRHGGDPDRLFIAGHSAGAHIAALIGTDARYLEAVDLHPRQLAGVIGIAGAYDFLPLTDDDLVAIFGAPADWPASQPVNFVDGDEPPFLLLHGDGDLLVLPRNSRRLAARLREAGVAVDERSYPGVGHIRILAGLRFSGLAPTWDDVTAFIEADRPPSASAARPD